MRDEAEIQERYERHLREFPEKNVFWKDESRGGAPAQALDAKRLLDIIGALGWALGKTEEQVAVELVRAQEEYIRSVQELREGMEQL